MPRAGGFYSLLVLTGWSLGGTHCCAPGWQGWHRSSAPPCPVGSPAAVPCASSPVNWHELPRALGGCPPWVAVPAARPPSPPSSAAQAYGSAPTQKHNNPEVAHTSIPMPLPATRLQSNATACYTPPFQCHFLQRWPRWWCPAWTTGTSTACCVSGAVLHICSAHGMLCEWLLCCTFVQHTACSVSGDSNAV